MEIFGSVLLMGVFFGHKYFLHQFLFCLDISLLYAVCGFVRLLCGS